MSKLVVVRRAVRWLGLAFAVGVVCAVFAAGASAARIAAKANHTWGEGGNDTFVAGSGNDLVISCDGLREVVNCGRAATA